jgi:hypothetical protein
VNSKVKSMLIILLDMKGFVRKEFVLAGHAVNSAYCCGVLRRLLENVRRLRPEIWRHKTWLLHRDNAPSHTYLFTRECFTKNNLTVVPNPPYFSVSPTEDKTERPPF